jgi:polyhydroxyalkanoate synthesis regulator protein
MIRQGDDIRIVDNKTKEDLTSVTLAQIIFEEEKKQKSFLSLQAMRNIIQSGGESLSHLVTEAREKITKVLPHRREHDTERPETEGEERHKLREFREWLQHTQRSMDDWQKRVDNRIRGVVEGISPFASLQKELRSLATRIEELESKLGDFKDED